MKQFLAIKDVIPGLAPEDLNIPLCETGIQSLDTIVLRDTLEKYFGFEIPDHDWYSFRTLAETLAYCNSHKARRETFVPGYKMAIRRSHEVTMPKMANRALSENWLLKELGDMHWELLTRGLEQRSSEFTDGTGNRLYAAFVRIRYSLDALDQFTENEQLHLDSEISRSGNYTYYTNVNGRCGDKTVKANLMTSFSARKANDNSQISKSNPEEKVNHIPELPTMPHFHSEHRLVKKGLVDEIQSGGYTFRLSGEIDSLVHDLNPHYEINGVGLVYFAAYPVIADRCASGFFRNTMQSPGHDSLFHTIHRDTFYFANCNASDRIVVKLNNAESLPGSKLKLVTSLYRESDNKLMAIVLTVKQTIAG